MIKLKVGLYKYKRVVGLLGFLFSTFVVLSQDIQQEEQPPDTLRRYTADSTLIQTADTTILPADTTLSSDTTLTNQIDATDTTLLNATDTTLLSDSTLIATDTVPQGDIETTINYFARDSMQLDLTTQEIDIYGEGKIVYDQIELTAELINVDYSLNEIIAEGRLDSLGKPIGEPVFKDGPEMYETEKIRYNFDSKKAIISGVVTQQGEGIMHGNRVKRNQAGDLYIDKAKYTTCNLPDPHFHIEARKLKLVPNNKVLVGPFHMEVMDIPLPVGWAFGMFPMPRKKASGIRVPTFGEEKRRGFFLRNGGYYFAINDYIDLELLGEIYSKGSYGVNVASTYRKRYSFNGTFSFKYNRQKGVEEGDSSVIKDFWINWSHTPQSKGTGRFSASVRAGSSSYNQNNPNYYNLMTNVNQEFSSNVSYSKSFTGTPFSMGANMRLQQNTRTGIVNMQLPDLSLSMSRIYPFKGKAPSARNIFQKINFSWNMTGTNRITNAPVGGSTGFDVSNPNPLRDSVVAFSPSNWEILVDRMQNGVRHSIPISTSSKILKHFTISPSINYNEIWYSKEMNYTWLDSVQAVRIDTTQKFSRLFSYSGGAGVNTRLYGTMFFKGDKVQAIRHVITPNVSFSYAPDFSDDRFGYYQEVQVDSTGRTQRLSKYNGFVYGTPTQGESASLGFSIQNTLEMKVRSKNDTASESKKVPIFENLGFSSGYNFLADSFNLSPIRITARTRLFNNKLDVNIGGTLDPYIHILDTFFVNEEGEEVIRQTKVSQYAWDNGQGLGQISSANFSLSTNLNPEAWQNKAAEVDKEELTDAERAELEYIENNPDLYVDFDIPWNVRINYNVNYTKRGFEKANITQSLNVTGDFSLTPKWKVGYRTGYDFQNKEFTQTSIDINRDLHCWQLTFNWVPFGRFTSYNVTIRAKSSLLQDLKLNKQRSFWDR